MLVKNKPFVDKIMSKYPAPIMLEERPEPREQEYNWIYVYRV